MEEQLTMRVRAVGEAAVYVVDPGTHRMATPRRRLGLGPGGDEIPARRTADGRLVPTIDIYRNAIEAGDLEVISE